MMARELRSPDALGGAGSSVANPISDAELFNNLRGQGTFRERLSLSEGLVTPEALQARSKRLLAILVQAESRGLISAQERTSLSQAVVLGKETLLSGDGEIGDLVIPNSTKPGVPQSQGAARQLIDRRAAEERSDFDVDKELAAMRTLRANRLHATAPREVNVGEVTTDQQAIKPVEHIRKAADSIINDRNKLPFGLEFTANPGFVQAATLIVGAGFGAATAAAAGAATLFLIPAVPPLSLGIVVVAAGLWGLAQGLKGLPLLENLSGADRLLYAMQRTYHAPIRAAIKAWGEPGVMAGHVETTLNQLAGDLGQREIAEHVKQIAARGQKMNVSLNRRMSYIEQRAKRLKERKDEIRAVLGKLPSDRDLWTEAQKDAVAGLEQAIQSEKDKITRAKGRYDERQGKLGAEHNRMKTSVVEMFERLEEKEGNKFHYNVLNPFNKSDDTNLLVTFRSIAMGYMQLKHYEADWPGLDPNARNNILKNVAQEIAAVNIEEDPNRIAHMGDDLPLANKMYQRRFWKLELLRRGAVAGAAVGGGGVLLTAAGVI